MIAIPGFMNLEYELLLTLKWYNSVYNHTNMSLGSKQPQKYSVFLQNEDWLGRFLQGWSKHLSMIPIPGFVYLSNELILTLYYYNAKSKTTHTCASEEGFCLMLPVWPNFKCNTLMLKHDTCSINFTHLSPK